MLSPLFGFVLAGVPAARAGVGSGLLTTMQQAALALGVASLGSLFLSLSPADSLGMRGAFVAVLSVQTAVSVVVAVGARTLPQPARSAPQREPAGVPPEAALGVEPAA